MHQYHHILLATEKLPLPKKTLSWVKELSIQAGAKVSVLHTVPALGKGIEYLLPSVTDLEKQQIANAKLGLETLKQALGASYQSQRIVFGNLANAIVGIAKQSRVDLIILNVKHHRQLKAILRKASCDILSI